MDPMQMKFSQGQKQSLKQLQRLIMSPQMQQAIHLMQMPVLELAQAIQGEMEKNPLLEYDEEKPDEELKEIEEKEVPAEAELSLRENDFEILKRLDEDFRSHFNESESYSFKRTSDEEKLKLYQEQSIPSEETLFEHLMHQANETFTDREKLAMAEALIGNFEGTGLITVSVEEIAQLNGFDKLELQRILSQIQSFDPPGVGATSLRECMLIQLRQKRLESTLAYRIISRHFDDLLHNRIPAISKTLKCPAESINEAIDKHIAQLDLHPGNTYSSKSAQMIVPDATISQDDEKLIIVVNDDHIPIVRLNSKYLRMLEDKNVSKEAKEFIHAKLLSAKWLIKNIDQRNDTLYRITENIAKRQGEFLKNPGGNLIPMTMKMVAEDLSIHESTVARAVSGKYVDTPRGLYPLRFFFSNAYTTEEGVELSSNTVKEALKRIVDGENKKRPLSDEALSKKLQEQGILCARRTVAKYRSELMLGNAKQRKQF